MAFSGFGYRKKEQLLALLVYVAQRSANLNFHQKNATVQPVGLPVKNAQIK
jgi:hypothetical protein